MDTQECSPHSCDSAEDAAAILVQVREFLHVVRQSYELLVDDLKIRFLGLDDEKKKSQIGEIETAGDRKIMESRPGIRIEESPQRISQEPTQQVPDK